MSFIRRAAKVGSIVVLGVAASGCIVLPFGAGHGRHSRGERYLAPASEGPPIVIVNPRDRPGRGGR